MHTSMSDWPRGALSDCRVVDFGQYVAGPLTALFLADNGADVIHVDPPAGPTWSHPSNAALYRGKRAVHLDLKTSADLVTARRLVTSADIVIENFRPGVMARLGLRPEDLTAENQGLIWCSLPGFSADDRRSSLPAWEGVVSAAVSLYSPPDFLGEPVFSALPLTSTFAAFVAAHRITGALLARLQHGKGQQIEVPLFEAAFQAVGMYAEIPESRDIPRDFLRRMRAITRIRPTSDKHLLYFDTPFRGVQTFIDRFCPGYDLLDLDEEAAGQLASALDDLLRSKAAHEWERIGQEQAGGAFGLIQSTDEWLQDRHALESKSVIEVEDPYLGPTKQPGYPVLLSDTPARVRFARGAYDEASPEAITWLHDARFDPPTQKTTSGLPLEGVRVLDCSSLVAGPTTTRILAQYGAEVLKVDRAGIAADDIDPLTDDQVALCGHRTVNAGKQMAFIDIKHDVGRDVLEELIRTSDVVHHNFTPGAAQRLGLSDQDVRALNQRCIISTLSLHSYGGFRHGYRGHDMVAQMVTGMAVRMGGDGAPRTMSTVVNDHGAGHLNAFGIMLALLDRNRTGKGQSVNASLSRTATLHQFPFAVGFSGKRSNEPAGPGAVGWHPFDRLYRANNGWFYVGSSDAMSGRSMLDGVPLIMDGAVTVPEDLLPGWLESRIAGLSVDECVAAFTAAGFGAHRYVPLTDLLLDSYVERRRLIAVAEHPGIGRAMGIGHPMLGAPSGPFTEQLVARRPGMDTIEVLIEHGFESQIVRLARDGAIGIGENAVVNTTSARGYWTMAAGTPSPVVSPQQASFVVDRIQQSELGPTYTPHRRSNATGLGDAKVREEVAAAVAKSILVEE